MLHDRARADFDRYRPAEPREANFLTRMQDLLASPDAFSRRHFQPGHFTASAFVVSPAQDELLLILHAKLGSWLQPGGHIELGDEDLARAAGRELVEETGVAIELATPEIFDLDVHAIPARKDEPAHEHFDVRFRFVASRRQLERSNEVLEARWVKLTELESVTRDESVLRAARKLG